MKYCPLSCPASDSENQPKWELRAETTFCQLGAQVFLGSLGQTTSNDQNQIKRVSFEAVVESNQERVSVYGFHTPK